MTSNPPPRPALRKAADAAVHPAAARLVPVAAQVPPKPKGGGKGKRSKGAPAEPSPVDPQDAKSVELVVVLPKAMRKRLKVKAKEHGYSAEEVTYQLVKAWLEGR